MVRVMKDKVKSHYSDGNPDTTSVDQLRDMLVTVVRNKALILVKAAVLDTTMDVVNHPVSTTISGLLAELIPNKVSVKIAKSNISAALVDTWSVLSEVLKYCTFRQREAHDLQTYIQYMSRVELVVKRVLDEDKSAPKNMKSITLSSTMMDRCYLDGGGFAGGGGNVTLSSSRKSPHLNVASGSNLGGESGNVASSGYPKFDIFAPLAAQAKKRSGTDRIWGRTRGANARELHLDIAKDDLTSPMKKLRKAAKKTAKKMKQDDGDHLDSVHCMLATDGIPLSQATAYEEGDVRNKHGGTFCSQRALRQYRNSNESDSDD